MTFDGDAFSGSMKAELVARARSENIRFDLVIYSLASPVRVDPQTGAMYKSVIKPLYKPYRGKSVDMFTGAISEAEIAEATEAESFETVKVMGGEDWQLWIEALARNGLLAPDATTLAYSYIGPALSWPIYHDGTIGKAKAHLEYTASLLNRDFGATGLRAFVSVNKALVTRASAVIPIIPLYVSTLFKVMKERGIHEDCIAQADRLFRTKLYAGSKMILDEAGRIRIDDLEMRSDVQREVESRMQKVKEDNLFDLADIEGFRTDFLRIHGFSVDGIDYSADVPSAGVCISRFDPVGTVETVQEGVRGKP
jgi:enoyl-[acyl-carrier protein] reductase/trans-2-enoyl-CoA reductase (NAD+)